MMLYAMDPAARLHLSPNTRYLIKSKLGVASDIELILVALRQGILGEPWHNEGRDRPMD